MQIRSERELTGTADSGRAEENSSTVAIFDSALIVAFGLRQADAVIATSGSARSAGHGENGRQRRKTRKTRHSTD